MSLFLPRPDLLAPYLITVAFTELTPGPNMGYLAIIGARWGRAAGLASVAGVTLGLAAYLFAAAAGVAQLAVKVDWLYEGLRWLGAAYLVWLAVESWRGHTDIAATDGEAGPSGAKLFMRGLLANLLNPKAALFYAVLLPGFTEPGHGNLAVQVLALGSIHLAVATIVHTVIVVTASGLRPPSATWGGAGDRLVGRVMACGLAAMACWLVWETQRP
jgi:threonine/homoserine/homoserine lactone efflux protein